MTLLFAEELTAPELARCVSKNVVGVLPVTAIEPHLPLSTDCDIARGHLTRLSEFVAPDDDVLVLPLQTIGAGVDLALTAFAELAGNIARFDLSLLSEIEEV